MLSALKDAETGQRGYLLTNRSEYLEPYHNGVINSKKYLNKSKLLILDSVESHVNIKTVENLIQQKLNELKQTIELSEVNRQKSLAILNSGFGKNIMDKIRDSIEKYINIEKKLLEERKQSFDRQNQIIILLFILEFLLIFGLIILIHRTIEKSKKLILELDASLDIIDKHIIYSKTDDKGIITETSLAFEQLSGYEKNELVGQSHNVIRHSDNSQEFFKEIWITVRSGKPWQGIIKNRKKDGSTYFVMSTINPQYDDIGNIRGFIFLRQDVTQQKEHEKQLLLQSRMAQMGEMISMIAHQWRQPLNTLGLITQKLDLYQSRGLLDDEKIQSTINSSMNLINNMSNTIDDFKNFFSPNKKPVTMKLENMIEKSLILINASFIKDNIQIIEQHNSTEKIELYDSEMMQVILNILRNSQDVLNDKEIKDPYIKITTGDTTITICDNGGGISKDVISKIFDPYFSTKDEKNGTGLGLYMSKIIVEDYHHGILRAENIDDGVCFIITLGEISKK